MDRRTRALGWATTALGAMLLGCAVLNAAVDGPLVTTVVFALFGLAAVGLVVVVHRASRRDRELGRDPKDNWFNNGVDAFGRRHPVLAWSLVAGLCVVAVALRVLV